MRWVFFALYMDRFCLKKGILSFIIRMIFSLWMRHHPVHGCGPQAHSARWSWSLWLSETCCVSNCVSSIWIQISVFLKIHFLFYEIMSLMIWLLSVMILCVLVSCTFSLLLRPFDCFTSLWMRCIAVESWIRMPYLSWFISPLRSDSSIYQLFCLWVVVSIPDITSSFGIRMVLVVYQSHM